LPASGDHNFARIDTVFASDDVFRWGLISRGLIVRVKIFPLQTPQNHQFCPVFGLRKFRPKTIYNGDATE